MTPPMTGMKTTSQPSFSTLGATGSSEMRP
jgi:hypothetical protein